MIRFKTWLKKQKKRDNSIGDLAKDYIVDERCLKESDEEGPKNTIESWREYLAGKDACEGAINALNKAWAEYKEGIWLRKK